MRKINRVLLLFVAVVLSAGVCRGQEQTEDFAAFASRFLSDCESQKSRVTFPLQSRHLDEDTFRDVVVEEGDWQCMPVSSFSIKMGECVRRWNQGCVASFLLLRIQGYWWSTVSERLRRGGSL